MVLGHISGSPSSIGGAQSSLGEDLWFSVQHRWCSASRCSAVPAQQALKKSVISLSSTAQHSSPNVFTVRPLFHPFAVVSLIRPRFRRPSMFRDAIEVARMIYTNSGGAILALASNAVHKLWKWQKTDRNATVKATAAVAPQLWQPTSGILMTNEISDTNPEEAIHCFALSKNDSYVMSASGGKISLFNMMTFKTMTTFMPPPPTATYLTFHPQDNNILAIGMDDASIQIYNVRVDEVKSKLRGHQKRIAGLAFSNVLNVLLSSGADAQLCVWGMDSWDKQASKFLQIPPGRMAGPLAETKVQFHQDQVHFLVVHESQIAIYDATKLECLKQWLTRDVSVTHATYSCDSQMIYASFTDGSVSVFTSTLRLRCRISPTAYLNPPPSSNVYPVVIAAHPTEPSQFALGLTDGGVQVLEPLESEGKWGSIPPPESGVGASSTSSQVVGNHNPDQPPR